MISVGYDFNPRSREGSDDSVQFTDDRLGVISIRAPARGATFLEVVFSTSNLDFNPRSHEGSDFSHLHNHLHLWNFNPRSHEGSDICIGWYPTCGRYFNPRSHEGSDHFSYPPKDINTVFQSALPRGERLAAALVNAFA